jgi:Spondin_N
MNSKSKRISIMATLFALAIIGLSAFTLKLTSARGPIHDRDSDEGFGGGRFEVTVTNLTRGQEFAPILVASHRDGFRLFKFGEPVSPQMAILAEEGFPTPLADVLSGMPEVKDVVTSPFTQEGTPDPGKSFTLTVKAPYPFNHISVAAMIVPTNDGFFAIDGVEVPRGKEELTLYSPAYDAGSERNDELCASIPGDYPECSVGSPPGNADKPTGGEEGFVHVHAGIHGVGHFAPAKRDWRNPVAKVTIRRVR